jgi:hypothetical protein
MASNNTLKSVRLGRRPATSRNHHDLICMSPKFAGINLIPFLKFLRPPRDRFGSAHFTAPDRMAASNNGPPESARRQVSANRPDRQPCLESLFSKSKGLCFPG